jgi:hypothetical protein
MTAVALTIITVVFTDLGIAIGVDDASSLTEASRLARGA